MLKPGDMIGDWRILRPLGQGGMGSVYRCRHGLSERIEAAVKVLEPSGIPGERERFIREAEALHALRHPAIVRITGFGTDAGTGLPFLAMELVEGDDFDRLITQRRFPRHRAAEIFSTLADGLAYAHGRGVFHRDLKPANLMLQADGAPVLLDFGIAVQVGQDRLTQEGVVPGTIAYAAPEQLREGVALDPVLCDLYALGQVFCECMTGELTYPRDPKVRDHQRSVQILRAKLKLEPLDPGPSAPPSIRDLVRSSTVPDPARRGPPFAQWGAVLAGQPLPNAEPEEATVLGVAPTAGSLRRPRPVGPSGLPLDVALPGQPPEVGSLGDVETVPEGRVTSTAVRRRRTVGVMVGSAGAVLVFGLTFLLTLAVGGAALVLSMGWGAAEPVEPVQTFRLGDVLTEDLTELDDLRTLEAQEEITEEPLAVAPARPPPRRAAQADTAEAGETKLVVASDLPSVVYVNGERVKNSPLIIRMEPGGYQIELKAAGDRSRSFPVWLRPGEVTRRIWSFEEGEWRSFEGGVDPKGLAARPPISGVSQRLSSLPATRDCVADAGLTEPVKLSLVIVPDGTVVAEGLQGAHRGTSLDHCLKRAARELSFRPSLAGAALSVEVRP